MIQFRTVCLSAHLNPLCRKMNELSGGQFLFVYRDADAGATRKLYWKDGIPAFPAAQDSDGLRMAARDADALLTMLREFPLWEYRIRRGLPTYYASERWLKPKTVRFLGWRVNVPGIVRVFYPAYFHMLRRFATLMKSPHFVYLPTGVVAARDMLRLVGLVKGDLRCLFRAPKIEFERRPGGAVKGCPNMRMWGYFVESSTLGMRKEELGIRKEELGIRKEELDSRKDGGERILKILWVGRIFDWKRVDVLVKAAQRLRDKVDVDIYGEDYFGHGKEKNRLIQLAEGLNNVHFHGFVPNDEVRRLMHTHDVYVLTSDGGEGWGAIVNEALSEGMPVIGTFEAGSSSTMLPSECLYHAGDVDALCSLLLNFDKISANTGYEFTGDEAASWLMNEIKRHGTRN